MQIVHLFNLVKSWVLASARGRNNDEEKHGSNINRATVGGVDKISELAGPCFAENAAPWHSN